MRAGIVSLWPRAVRATRPPLLLRLVRIGRAGKAVYLLTSVLDPSRLGRREVGELYRKR